MQGFKDILDLDFLLHPVCRNLFCNQLQLMSGCTVVCGLEDKNRLSEVRLGARRNSPASYPQLPSYPDKFSLTTTCVPFVLKHKASRGQDILVITLKLYIFHSVAAFSTGHHNKGTPTRDLPFVFTLDSFPEVIWAQTCSLRITRPQH